MSDTPLYIKIIGGVAAALIVFGISACVMYCRRNVSDPERAPLVPKPDVEAPVPRVEVPQVVALPAFVAAPEPVSPVSSSKITEPVSPKLSKKDRSSSKIEDGEKKEKKEKKDKKPSEDKV